MKYRCIECGKEYDLKEVRYRCDCLGLLEVVDEWKVDINKLRQRPFGVWRYRELLPVTSNRIITLNEGGTHLHECKSLAKEIGIRKLWVKNEGENPTGSFKDRGMTVGITKALEYGFDRVGCASTGNTAASMSAYAAKAGIDAIVLLPAKKIAFGKLAQTMIYGAKIIAIRDNFDQAMDFIWRVTKQHRIYLLNSINPFRLEGQKTLGFEIMDQLDFSSPDRIILPIGNAGNISALWKAMRELRELDLIDQIPRLMGIQAEGASPIVDMIQGKSKFKPVAKPETIASAIRIGNPVNWPKAIRAIRDSKGSVAKVSDREILRAQKTLARREGIFVEPASAASIAGLKKLLRDGKIGKDEEVVCVTTGNGLKDPDMVVEELKRNIIEIEPDFDKLEKIIG